MPPAPGWLAHPVRTDDSRRVAALLGLLFGLGGMGSSSASVALPRVAADLGVSIGVAAWAISLYVLMLAVATALYGRISDLVGVRIPLAVGLGLMSVGALGAALAPSYEVLLVSRVLQGTGAAAAPTLGVAVLTRRYAGPTRAHAFGILAGITAALSALGPFLGGVVEAGLGWRAVLALPVLGLLVLPAIWYALPGSGTGARLDLLGAALVTGTAAGLVLLVQSPSTGRVVAAVGAVLLALGVPSAAAWIRRRPDGFLPLEVVRNPVVVRSGAAAASIPASWFALLVAVPATLVEAGWEPWQVGVLMLPAAVVGLLVPRVTGPMITRIGPARSLALATVIASTSLLLSGLGAHLLSPVVLGTAVVVTTIAFGIGQPSLNAAVGDAVAEDVRGVALGVATLMFLIGGSVGSAVVGGLAAVAGMPTGLLVVAALPMLGLLAVAPLVRRAPAPGAR